MAYMHIVSFRYKSQVPESTRSEVHKRFLALQKECRLQDGHGEQYIQALIGGSRNISPEGAGKGFDHLYVVTFHSGDHVPYYLDHDPAHNEFKSFVGPLIEDAFIYDFE